MALGKEGLVLSEFDLVFNPDGSFNPESFTPDFNFSSLFPEFDFSSSMDDPFLGASSDFASPSGGSTLDDIRVTDNTTGNTMTLREAQILDPTAAQEFIQSQPGLMEQLSAQPMPGGTTPPTPAPGLLQRMSTFLGEQNPLVLAGLGLTGLAAGGGLIGVVQKAMQGDPTSRTEVQRLVASADPAERQAVGEALQAIQGANQFALGSPTGLMSQLGGRTPTEESAFGGAAQRLDQRGSIQDALQQLMGPQVGPGAANILGGQESILSALGPAATDLAKGKLTISPELAMTIEQAFQPKMGDIATQLINAARERGFAGGAELLLQAPASQLGQTAARDLQGQMAAAKLEAALKFPQAAAELSNAMNTPAAIRMQGASQLAGMDQNLIAALGGLGQSGMQNRLGFLQALTAPANAAANIAGTQANTRLGSAGQTSTTTVPSTLLDAFAPLGGFLGGIGGALGGIAALSGNPRSGLSGRP